MIAKDQEILFAVGLGGGRVLGYQGSLCFLACTDVGIGNDIYWPEVDGILPIGDVPAEPGVYLWKGEIEESNEFDEYYGCWTGPSLSLRGETVPATLHDMDRLMGKHEPLPEDEDRS